MHPMNLESLERRRMLATHVFAGTAGPDIIHISYTPWTVTVTINAVNHSMSEGQIDEFIVDGLGGDDQINIEGSGTKPLHVWGGDGDDTVRVTPGSQDFEFIKGRLLLRGDAGANLLLLSDQSNPGGTSYFLTADSLWSFGLVQPIRFEQFGDVIFQAGQAADTINIRSTAAGVNYTVKSGGTNVQDYIRIGSETNTLAELLGNLNVDGQEGLDRIEFRDDGNAGHDQYKLYDSSFKHVGNWPAVHFNNVKFVRLLAGAGANAIDVESTRTGVSTSVLAGDGNDLVRVAPTAKTFDAIQSQLFVDGEAGADHVNMHDENGENEHYQVEPFSVRRGLKHVDFSSFELLKLFTTTGNNWINVHGTNDGTPVYLDPSAGDDIINVMSTAANAPVTLAPTSGRDSVWVGAGSGERAELILDSSHDLMQLSIGGTGVVRVARAHPSQGVLLVKMDLLQMDADGILDLGDNALAIDYPDGNSPIDTVRALLASGHNGGAWTGRGITSSAAAGRPGHALGYAEASDVFSQFPATFAGHSIGDDTTVLVRFTRSGDANLDGTVNLADFNRLAANFGASDRGWSQGNFTYDATVNLSDFNLLAINFGKSVELQS